MAKIATQSTTIPETYLTPTEAAERLHLTPRMVQIRIRQGKIPVTLDRLIPASAIEGQGRLRAPSSAQKAKMFAA